ncbi:MAG: hypothetical protein FWF92_04465 [Oscillospiraceae bacterium]|nr:hypothetical protein [Oscillospiraceae bacterium]
MNMKQIISLILLIAFAISTIFNVLFLLGSISEIIMQTVFFILLLIIFVISVLGISLKNIKKEDHVTINIITPAKELGALYGWLLIIWAVTYFLAIIFK